MMLVCWRCSLRRRHFMQNVDRVLTRQKRFSELQVKVAHRKLLLPLYELEPESGEDDGLNVELPLDQLED